MEGMIGSGGDHGGLGDGDICICRKVLTLLLFVEVDRQWQAWVDGFHEICNVVVDVGLINIVALV